jgi:hypothetical protein
MTVSWTYISVDQFYVAYYREVYEFKDFSSNKVAVNIYFTYITLCEMFFFLGTFVEMVTFDAMK